MAGPISLVTKPSADEEVRESVVRLLREALAQAEAGEVDTVLMILGHPDETWSDIASETVSFSHAVGRLEILKQKWIAKYLLEGT